MRASGLAGCGDAELRARYREVGSSAGDGRPEAVADLDELVAELLRRDPGDAALWDERGLLARRRRDWASSLACHRVALDLLPAGDPRVERTAWQLGVAATAMGAWTSARTAWTALGFELPRGEDAAAPVELDLGPAPVRLRPAPDLAGDDQVVWGRRICPARTRITTIPPPESGHRYGDVVLHDGVPAGERRLGGREYAVFDEIEVWRRSPLATFTATVEVPDPRAVVALAGRLHATGGTVEDWTAAAWILRRTGDAGRTGAPHRPAPDGGRPRRVVALAADPGTVSSVLDGWAAEAQGRGYSDLVLVRA